jgi:DNA helicase-2/ATP-dependent DNA helicase PcrA
MPHPELNSEQLQAISYTEGPLLIVAGAGTGKTTVITQKITRLITENKVKPEEILALTFTEKAAFEMLTRVEEALGESYSDLQISTFHAFCQRILEAHGLDIGLPTPFKLVTELQAWFLVKEAFKSFDLKYYRPQTKPTPQQLLKSYFVIADCQFFTVGTFLSFTGINCRPSSWFKSLKSVLFIY